MHLSEKASKSTFVKPEKLQNPSNEGKGEEKKKECMGIEKERRRRKKKSNGCTLSFYNSYFFGRKKLSDTKGLFGDNVIKNPARYVFKIMKIKVAR